MAVTLAARDIGTARIGEHQIRVQRRDGSHGVWMTLLASRESNDASLGTISDLNTDSPSVWIFEQCVDWDTPEVHAILVAAVRPLYRADEARHAG